ncbi:MAG: molybdopterin-dependent oxidoreductase, partial [Leptolyngbyaceae cyanobacterium SU_3_3]|nr:molybdopterin-dependent oxidoreductase [Leptolyngbyaceae cyanobacterium SU_3_3]
WEAVVETARSTPWAILSETCGVSQTEIEAAAEIIGSAKGVVFGWAMGITQHDNGVDNVFSIINTALISGNIGREGAGVMPVRGHSNVQGFGSMGVTTQELKKGLQTALERLLGRPLNDVKGYDTRALIEAADKEKVDTLICLGGNLYGANPDSAQAKRALSKVSTIVYLSTKPNIGHFNGLAKHTTIILPVLNRFENPYKTTTESGSNFVRLSDEGTTHLKHGDLRPEVEFLTELAHRIHGEYPVDWRKLRDPKFIRHLIAETVPGFEKMATIDETQEEFTIGGRIVMEPKFSTPSGKAVMFVPPLPTLTLPDAQSFDAPDAIRGVVVALMTGRSYAQHNTVVYQVEDKYRGMPHRNCILMHRSDAEQAGLSEHQRVTVQGNVGKLENVEVIYGAVRPGAALMFYPEVNVIFSAKIEHRSGTPAFKRVPVLVYASAK